MVSSGQIPSIKHLLITSSLMMIKLDSFSQDLEEVMIFSITTSLQNCTRSCKLHTNMNTEI